LINYAAAFWELPYEEYTGYGSGLEWCSITLFPSPEGQYMWRRAYTISPVDRNYLDGSSPSYTMTHLKR